MEGIVRVVRRVCGLITAHPVRFNLVTVAAAFVVHLTVLLCCFEEINPEEQWYGNLAKDLSEGLIASATEYRHSYREGGPLPFSLWVYGFFALLGPSLFALKAAALSFMAVGSWPWVDLARRSGGPLAALTAAALFVLPFPFYLRATLNGGLVSNHQGTIVFAGLALWLLYRGFVDRSLPSTPAALGCGLCLGAGCFWMVSFGSIAAGIGLVAIGMRIGARNIACIILGGVPGLAALWRWCIAPLAQKQRGRFFAESTHHTWAEVVVPDLEIYDTPGAADYLAELGRLLTSWFPRVAGFVDSTMVDVRVTPLHPSWIYFAALIGAVAILVYTRSATQVDKRIPLLLWTLPPFVLYFGVYLTSGFWTRADDFVWQRHYTPLAPWIFLVAAHAVAALQDTHPERGPRLAAGGLLFTVALGGLSVANVAELSAFPTAYRAVRGYNMDYFTRDRTRYSIVVQVAPPPGEMAGYARNALALPGRADHAFFAHALGMEIGLTDNATTALTVRRELPEELRPELDHGLGTGLRLRLAYADRPRRGGPAIQEDGYFRPSLYPPGTPRGLMSEEDEAQVLRDWIDDTVRFEAKIGVVDPDRLHAEIEARFAQPRLKTDGHRRELAALAADPLLEAVKKGARPAAGRLAARESEVTELLEALWPHVSDSEAFVVGLFPPFHAEAAEARFSADRTLPNRPWPRHARKIDSPEAPSEATVERFEARRARLRALIAAFSARAPLEL